MRNRYLLEKLRDAARSITDGEGPPQERLRHAFDSLSRLTLAGPNFPDPEGAAEFESILAALTKYGEGIAGEGSVPTTTWAMSNEEAESLGERIVNLARRYGEA